jgi:hypothetical protein
VSRMTASEVTHGRDNNLLVFFEIIGLDTMFYEGRTL